MYIFGDFFLTMIDKFIFFIVKYLILYYFCN